jgi:hypothetical protein
VQKFFGKLSGRRQFCANRVVCNLSPERWKDQVCLANLLADFSRPAEAFPGFR